MQAFLPQDTIIIIQARSSSTRLPGKMLMEFVPGFELVAWVYERCATLGIPVIVATSDEQSDDELAAICVKRNIPLFRGSLTDVLGRFISCAESVGAKAIIRVCGDSPFVDISLMKRLCEKFSKGNCDYVSVLTADTVEGMDAELVSLDALQRVRMLSLTPSEREHVTLPILKRKDLFSVRLLSGGHPASYVSGLKLTVDSCEDFSRCCIIAKTVIRDDKRFQFISSDVFSVAEAQDMISPYDKKLSTLR